MLNNKQTLPIQIAYRRVIQLLAGGLFLPGSAGIIDPCETGNIRIQSLLSLEQQDLLCMTTQHLVRVMAHGGFIAVLNGNDSMPNLLLFNWKVFLFIEFFFFFIDILKLKTINSVIFDDLQKAYEKQDDLEDSDLTNAESEEMAMDT